MHWTALFLIAAVGLLADEGLTESLDACKNPKKCQLSPLHNDTWKTEEVRELLTHLFECYDNRVQPSHKKKTIVYIDMYILAIGNFEVRDMNYDLTFYFREKWEDKRLAFGNHFFEDHIDLTGNILSNIWRPDTFFVDKKGEGYVNKESFLARIYRNGTMLSSTQNSITVHCSMDLREFPMDEQQCNLTLESFGFTVDHVLYKWVSKDPSRAVQFNPNLITSDFTLGPMKIHEYNASYTTGVYSGLRLVFTFRRKVMYFVIQIYAPSAMIVILSWISFWIDYKSVPARTALGITTVLAMTTLLFGVQSSLPRVPYIKAVDLFMIVSFACVFAALIEFAVVNYLSTRGKDGNGATLRKYCQCAVNKVHNLSSTNGASVRNVENGLANSNATQNKPQMAVSNGDCVNPRDPAHDVTSASRDSSPGSPPDGRLNYKRSYCWSWDLSADAIDAYSRILFPLTYAVFNLVYVIRHMSDVANGPI